MNKKNSTILVTGGAGYIGSHTCVLLLEAGYSVIVVDNLSNSSRESLRRIEQITNSSIPFYHVDIRDETALKKIFQEHKIGAVIHFAGLKAVGESCQKPIDYYHNNVYGTMVLSHVMAAADVKKLVFSSSATVYGIPDSVPITEDFPLSATNPYGRSKLMVEDMLRDLSASDGLNNSENPWKISLLRYFNPVGAHSSGMIGEDPNGVPNNLMPFITQVAVGKLDQLSVFGNDYPTPDGTGIRDYIHVVDLAKGHLKALSTLTSDEFLKGACKAYNLGTGNGYSVLEMIDSFEKITGKKVNYKIISRRPGDVAQCYSNSDYAENELNWKAEKGLQEMIVDTWRWQVKNPQGYNNSLNAL